MASLPALRLDADTWSRLPEKVGFKDELIEGERVLAPMPAFLYSVVLDNLQALLQQQFAEHRVLRETGWKFSVESGLENVPGPDLMVVTVEDYKRAASARDYFTGIPLIVVEVVSPNERKARRMQKVGLYLDAGAAVVVEIDYTKLLALVYRPDQDFPFVTTDQLDSPFRANVSDLLLPA